MEHPVNTGMCFTLGEPREHAWSTGLGGDETYVVFLALLTACSKICACQETTFVHDPIPY